MDMIINTIFPTAIGISDCPFINEIQEPYKKIIKDFKYESTGLCKERVHLNKKFKKLNEWVNEQVQKYAKIHLYKGKYNCTESWLLDYPLGSGQSFHRHPGFVFSVVFFLEGYENDTCLNFENPVVDMLNPLKVTAHDFDRVNDHVFNNNALDNIEYNELTYSQVSYAPKTGRLIVWRGHLAHGCYNKQLECKRIVFVYNYR
tara:strand:- start:347 stop:952 length:606 start_codon:yes stop_codon:yes gene_type:complete